MSTDPFYLSKPWFRARHSCLARAGFRCSSCQADIRGKGKALVHHVVPRKVAPHLELEASNLTPLCLPCHNTMHDNRKGGGDLQPMLSSTGYPPGWE